MRSRSAAQRLYLVAINRGLFEGQGHGGLFHGFGQALDHLVLLALEEHGGQLHVLGVILGGDKADAGTAAAVDLVQQTGPGAVGEDRILAGAQVEGLLQQVDGVPHHRGCREGAVVVGLAVRSAAEEGQARELIPGQLHIGVGLVVPEEDVEGRVQALDEVVFQQQGFGLGAGHGGIDAADAAHHEGDAGAGNGALEIGRNALLQVLRLADIEHLALGVEHAIDPRQVRQGRQEGLGVEGRNCRPGRRGRCFRRLAHGVLSRAGPACRGWRPPRPRNPRW